MIEVFYWPTPNGKKVTILLEELGLEYKITQVSISSDKQLEPGFLKLNPRGKVPVLKDDEFVLSESLAIMAYLDKKYPEPPLFGTSPQETGLIWRAILEMEAYIVSAGDKLVRPLFFGQGLEETDKIQEAAATIRRELKRIDTELEGASWLIGRQMSAADISLFPLVQMIFRAAGKDAATPFNFELLPLDKYFPHIAAWVKHIEALSGYERTYPPHWR